MALFNVKTFGRFARKNSVSDGELHDAAEDIQAGNFDADLGGGLFKQRVARDGGGKSSGYRVIVSCATDRHVFFLHGFPKNKKDNVSPKELKALQALGKVLSGLGEQEIQKAVEDGAIEEVQDDREQRQEN